MDKRHAVADRRRAEPLAATDSAEHAGPIAVRGHASELATAESVDASDGVDEQSEQSFPASDPPSWSGLSL
jgi:hypothetical protein